MEDVFDFENFLANLVTKPGVYIMFDKNSNIIYIGKARNLKNRVKSYFSNSVKDEKTTALVANVAKIEVTITPSEKEALLLELNLIKEFKPKYNIILKDDKSYPYLFFSEHPYPLLKTHRGSKTAKGKYFGPYPSAYALKSSVLLLQKIFKLRNCSDVYFKSRKRPCLQYQIERCSAPCVNYISQKEYNNDVKSAILFLNGKNNEVLDTLSDKMKTAANKKEYELAAKYRDQLRQLHKIQEDQVVYNEVEDCDFLTIANSGKNICFSVMYVRKNIMLAAKNFFYETPVNYNIEDTFASLVSQFYLKKSMAKDLPKTIVLGMPINDMSIVGQAINEFYGKNIKIQNNVRKQKLKILNLANDNCSNALASHIASNKLVNERFNDLNAILDFPKEVTRIECFDISHSGGEATVGSCVVFDKNGARKSDYRQYNILNVKKNDDYGAMRQVLLRCYKSRLENKKAMPDLVLIDGGKGQLNIAREVFNLLNIKDTKLLGIAKGPTRKAGLETIIISGEENKEWDIPSDSSVLHLLQQIRDEAHRFAITSHRKKRDKSRIKSKLDGIPGVGPRRRRELLQKFGSAKEVANASVAEIAKTPGISLKLAEIIFAELH